MSDTSRSQTSELPAPSRRDLRQQQLPRALPALAEATRRGAMLWTSMIIGVAGALLMLVRMFFPYAVGLADNGDGERYICQLRLVPVEEVPRYVNFAIFDWMPTDFEGGCNNYPSSQVWLLRAAQWLTEQFGGAPGDMNLRFLSIGYALLCGLLVGLFAYVVRGHIAARIALSILLLVVLGDGTFANYAGSTYGELPGLIGVAILSIAAVYLGTSGIKQWIGLALFAVGGVLALTSKTQGVTLIIPIAILLLCTTMRARRPSHTTPWWMPVRLLKTVVGKILPAAVAIALVVPVMWLLENNPKEFQAINPWELIAVGILGNSPNPGDDLVEMGFPRHLEEYAGESVWVKDPITTTPDWDANKHLMTYGTAAKFLLAHPDRAIVIANNAGNDWLMTRPDYLGSYEQGAGLKPAQMDGSFVTSMGQTFAGMGITPLLIIWGLISWGAIHLLRRSAPGTARRGMASAVLMLIGFAIVQFFTASFGEAIENTKHMVYGIFAHAIAVVLLLAGAIMSLHPEHKIARASQPEPIRTEESA